MRIPSFARPAVAAFALLAGAAWAAPGQAPQQDFHWSGVLAAGQRIEIKGVNGSISAEPASGNEVEVTAVRVAGRRDRVQDIRIERLEHEGGVTICAVYPTPPSDTRHRCIAGGEWPLPANNEHDGRVNFTVRVPRGVNFLGTTVNGSVRAVSMPADATASAVNGPVTVSAAGVVNASTVNGTIDATMGRANPGEDVEFASVNGDITVRVPAGFGARVDATLLNGQVGGDFPLRRTARGPVGLRADGQIGSGGHLLRIRTVNGNIAIRRATGD